MHYSSRFNVQGSRWARPPVSLNFEPGTVVWNSYEDCSEISEALFNGWND
jgi:hypothetical protein